MRSPDWLQIRRASTLQGELDPTCEIWMRSGATFERPRDLDAPELASVLLGLASETLGTEAELLRGGPVCHIYRPRKKQTIEDSPADAGPLAPCRLT